MRVNLSTITAAKRSAFRAFGGAGSGPGLGPFRDV